MSKNFTSGLTTFNGYTLCPAPVNGCINETASNPKDELSKDIYDAKQCHASFFLFRKPAGNRKIISKYELPVLGQMPTTSLPLTTHNSLLTTIATTSSNLPIAIGINTTAL